MFFILKFVPMSVLWILAQVVSFFAILTNASIYRGICINLMLVQPFKSAEERKKLAKIILQNQLASTLYSAKSWVMPPDWSIAQINTIHHGEILQKGLACPNGMLIIVPHIGTWEMMNAWVSRFGDLTIMYKPSGNSKLDKIVLQGREKLNATLVPTDGSGVKAIFKTLKNKGFSVLLPDHVPDKNGGEIVPFFGIPTMTGTLATKLASKTNCALVGLTCIKSPHQSGFEIFCYDLKDKDLYNKNDIIATTALNHAMQTMIEKHFEHYMWSYRRFKTTPFGENPYLLPFDELHTQVKNYKSNTPSEPSHDRN